jgi:hypothetical protein
MTGQMEIDKINQIDGQSTFAMVIRQWIYVYTDNFFYTNKVMMESNGNNLSIWGNVRGYIHEREIHHEKFAIRKP